MSDDPGRKKLLYKREKKYPENVINFSKSSVTIMFCGSAAGTLLPPYVIYRSDHMWDRWTLGGPKKYPCCTSRCCEAGTRYNRSKNGWIDAITFTDWFKSTFLPHATQLPGRKLLLGDNHSSHFTDEVLQLCQQNNISFVCLPPNTTHLTQSLDVCFFRPLKAAWRAILSQWKTSNPKALSFRKEELPTLLNQALIRMNEIEKNGAKDGISRNLVSGFEATGLFPFNSERVLVKIPDAENREEQFNNQFIDSLVDFLKEKRYNNVPVRQGGKKKKLNIVPGKSVSAPASSSSGSEELDEEPELDDGSDTSQLNDSEETQYTATSSEGLNVNTFVLVKIKSGKRQSTFYRYAAIISAIHKETTETEFRVTGLKCIDTGKQTFKVKENDEFLVTQEDILAILPEPEIQTSGDRVKYHFTKSVDVFEQ